ncbi:MAG: DUF3795 domain-containing protein [candidate division Zixibacteria bacterium]|nr:DUF3795 domain-containing protein [candidate division Zixibacteria bacterium]
MEKLISACGLYCASCEAYVATQAGDADEIAKIAAQWSKQYDAEVKPEHVWCDGCMTAGERKCGYVPACKVRACVVERGLDNCAPCADYGCGILAAHFEMSPAAKEALDALRGS